MVFQKSRINLIAGGISYRQAPVEQREKYSLGQTRIKRVLRSEAWSDLFEEVLVLDTCNRTEVYCVPDGKTPSAQDIMRDVAAANNLHSPSEGCSFYQYTGIEVVSHIFSVAASLDSQIVGEDEILGQLKKAYRQAHDAGTTGLLLNELFQRAFNVGKRVRSETMLNEGSCSLPRAAVKLAVQHSGDLADKHALIIGAGETAELVARALVQEDIDELTVTNRAVDAACKLAGRIAGDTGRSAGMTRRLCHGHVNGKRDVFCGFQNLPIRGHTEMCLSSAPRLRVGPLDRVQELMSGVDVVISCTGARDYVLQKRDMKKCLSRLKKGILLVDIAVPRDIDPRLTQFSAVSLYNIDDLKQLVQKNLARRREEMTKAKHIVAQEVERFRRWTQIRKAVPTIRLIRRHVEQVVENHIDRYAGNFKAVDREELANFCHSLCQKILYDPIMYLRRQAMYTDGGKYPHIAKEVRNIFGLEDVECRTGGESAQKSASPCRNEQSG